IGDTALPQALWATASTGTASWGWAIFNAASALRARLQEEFGGNTPAEGLEATGTFQANPEAQQYAMHAFGAQFAEVRVNEDTGAIGIVVTAAATDIADYHATGSRFRNLRMTLDKMLP